jgi:hypothetical protein
VDNWDIKTFQNLAEQVLSQLLMIEIGATNSVIQPVKKQDAAFLLVFFCSVGMIQVKPESQKLMVSNISK